MLREGGGVWLPVGVIKRSVSFFILVFCEWDGCVFFLFLIFSSMNRLGRGEWALTSGCRRLTVRITTSARRFVSVDALKGFFIACVSDSRMLFVVSKDLLRSEDIKNLPAAKTQLSDMKGCK